jgi:cell wall-associated NlpC family hydrolase
MSLSTTVSEHVNGISRSGAILAMSSGLVASMGISASAATRNTPTSGAVPLSAPAVDSASADPAQVAVSSALASGDPLTAPATATLTFDRSSITATPRPKPAAPAASRSTARTGLQSTSTAAKRSPGSSAKTSSTRSAGSTRGSSIIAVAARYVGIPYRYGGSTPAGFDCSGYTKYVYAQIGISIPRTADQQYEASTRISRSSARPGDLVFYLRSGNSYHVGIYAGNGMSYESPHTGASVTKRKIWSSNVAFGRF